MSREPNTVFEWYSDPLRHNAVDCAVCRADNESVYADCSQCGGDLTADCPSCKHRSNNAQIGLQCEALANEAHVPDADADVHDAIHALEIIDHAVWIAVGVTAALCLTVLTAVVIREAVKSG